MRRLAFPRREWVVAMLTLFVGLGLAGCDLGQTPPATENPLHLDELLATARFEGSEFPEGVPALVEWSFDEAQPDWMPVIPWNPTIAAAQVTRAEDALRVTLTDGTRNPNGVPRGGIFIDVPDWEPRDWGHVEVRARNSDGIQSMGLGFNLREGSGSSSDFPWPFRFGGDGTPHGPL